MQHGYRCCLYRLRQKIDVDRTRSNVAHTQTNYRPSYNDDLNDNVKHDLSRLQDYSSLEGSSNFNFIIFSVPAMYRCEGSSPSVLMACSQAVSIGGVVPCWVSRPWVRTKSGLVMHNCIEILYLIAYQQPAYHCISVAFDYNLYALCLTSQHSGINVHFIVQPHKQHRIS